MLTQKKKKILSHISDIDSYLTFIQILHTHMQELRGQGVCRLETEENTVPGLSENLAQTEDNKLTEG